MSQAPTNTVASLLSARCFHQALDALEAAEESKLLNLPVPGLKTATVGWPFYGEMPRESKAVTVYCIN